MRRRVAGQDILFDITNAGTMRKNVQGCSPEVADFVALADPLLIPAPATCVL